MNVLTVFLAIVGVLGQQYFNNLVTVLKRDTNRDDTVTSVVGTSVNGYVAAGYSKYENGTYAFTAKYDFNGDLRDYRTINGDLVKVNSSFRIVNVSGEYEKQYFNDPWVDYSSMRSFSLSGIETMYPDDLFGFFGCGTIFNDTDRFGWLVRFNKDLDIDVSRTIHMYDNSGGVNDCTVFGKNVILVGNYGSAGLLIARYNTNGGLYWKKFVAGTFVGRKVKVFLSSILVVGSKDSKAMIASFKLDDGSFEWFHTEDTLESPSEFYDLTIYDDIYTRPNKAWVALVGKYLNSGRGKDALFFTDFHISKTGSDIGKLVLRSAAVEMYIVGEDCSGKGVDKVPTRDPYDRTVYIAGDFGNKMTMLKMDYYYNVTGGGSLLPFEIKTKGGRLADADHGFIVYGEEQTNSSIIVHKSTKFSLLGNDTCWDSKVGSPYTKMFLSLPFSGVGGSLTSQDLLGIHKEEAFQVQQRSVTPEINIVECMEATVVFSRASSSMIVSLLLTLSVILLV